MCLRRPFRVSWACPVYHHNIDPNQASKPTTDLLKTTVWAPMWLFIAWNQQADVHVSAETLRIHMDDHHGSSTPSIHSHRVVSFMPGRVMYARLSCFSSLVFSDLSSSN